MMFPLSQEESSAESQGSDGGTHPLHTHTQVPLKTAHTHRHTPQRSPAPRLNVSELHNTWTLTDTRVGAR